MKLKLFMFLVFTSLILAQGPDRLTTGELATGDSTYEFYSAGREWVYIFLVDSASTNDSVVVEVQNPVNNNWVIIGVKDQSADDIVTVLVPTADTNGKLYIVWMLYPNKIRLRKTDVAQLTENIDYAIFSKGVSK